MSHFVRQLSGSKIRGSTLNSRRPGTRQTKKGPDVALQERASPPSRARKEAGSIPGRRTRGSVGKVARNSGHTQSDGWN